MRYRPTLFILALLCATASAQSTNPAVNQANIHSTICVKGWSKTVRPTWAYSSKVKRAMCKAQGMARCRPGLVLDHVVAIETGGSPTDVKNLQLQTAAAAHVKDVQENKARRDACSGRATLVEVQSRFKKD